MHLSQQHTKVWNLRGAMLSVHVVQQLTRALLSLQVEVGRGLQYVVMMKEPPAVPPSRPLSVIV